MNVNEFIVKENKGFRLRVKTWKCVSPVDLNSIEFIQEQLDSEGSVEMSSIYQFFMTNDDVEKLAQGLLTNIKHDSKVNV